MRNNVFILLLTMTVLGVSQAQNVGIGTDTPDPKSILDVESDSKGLLAPRMTTGQRTTISSSGSMPNGLLVFDTDFDAFFFWNESLNAGAGDWEQLGAVTIPTNAAWFEQSGTTLPDDITDLIYTEGVASIGVSASPSSAQLTLGGTTADEGGELQLNGGSSHSSKAYALDNFEGRLRILQTTNVNGTNDLATTNEFLSFKRTNSTSQLGIGLIGGNAWPEESNLVVGNNGTQEGGQIQLYSGSAYNTAWFLDVYNDDFRFLTGNNITGSSGMAAAINSSGTYAPSDKRIKDVIGQSNGSNDLDILNKIAVTDYRLKYDGTDKVFKKVIAQELREVYPNAVYLTAGKIQGKDIVDYHMVDYDAISMLNVSATQELYKILLEQQKLIEQLQEEIENLK